MGGVEAGQEQADQTRKKSQQNGERYAHAFVLADGNYQL
jgi:hypothetical protein